MCNIDQGWKTGGSQEINFNKKIYLNFFELFKPFAVRNNFSVA